MDLFFRKVSSYKQDSVWSWFICFCYTICMIFVDGLTFSLGVFFPVLMDSFNESRERTAWFTSIVVSVMCFTSPASGGLLNRFGIRTSTILGCLLCSSALAMGSFVPTIVTLYIAFSLPFGLGYALINLTSPIIATHYFRKKRTIALGFLMAGQGIGAMTLAPTTQALVDVFDWRNTFRVFAGLLALTSLTGWLLHKGITPPNEPAEVAPKAFQLNLALLRKPALLVLMLTRSVYAFCRLTPYVYLIKYSNDVGIPADKGATLFMFIGVFATIGRLGGGFLCNLKWIKARVLVQASAFAMGTSVILLTLAKTYGALVAISIVFSASDGIWNVTFLIECLNSVEESKQASAFGFTMISAGVFALGGPPLIGFIADKSGNYIAAFITAGGAGIVASLVPFLLVCVNRGSERNVVTDIEDSISLGEYGDVTERQLQLQQRSGDDALEHKRKSSILQGSKQQINDILDIVSRETVL
ncbi:unnamed protein product [Porites lobata]|uniref:Major facilitator superfamily (MFS) profile domain-containing protein n=1 Tax=Porites lobata TaxID=104759 RepID=A0ABN8RBB6_9CNID|nr:unnamed protein product [Porites lobata]